MCFAPFARFGRARVVSRAGLFGSGRVRARFGLKFVKMFRGDFGPAYKTFLKDSE